MNRNNDEWNLWEDEQPEEIEQKKMKRKNKKKRVPKSVESEEWGYESVDYLKEELGNVYLKDESPKYSRLKVSIFSILIGFCALFAIGYLNTDFDEFNKGYVVNYDLHYERQYVSTSDELYDYCLELKEELKTKMPDMVTNSLTTTNEIKKIQETLKGKTDKLSRYTEVPQIMSSYNDNLISFSLSSQKMLTTMLSNYTNKDYLAWAEKAYTDFSGSLQTIEYLRAQINEVIYRNVYGGGENGE